MNSDHELGTYHGVHSSGRTFATKDSPYIQHLDGLAKNWTEAEEIVSILKAHAAEVRKHKISPHDESSIAQIIDVPAQGEPRLIQPLTLKDLRNASEADSLARVQLVDTFLGRLHAAPTNVHTRIIMIITAGSMDEAAYTPALRATVELFHAHLLGVELDLDPLLVAQCCRHQQIADAEAHMPYTMLGIGQASYGSWSQDDAGCYVKWLGQRGQDPHFTVLVSLSKSWTLPCDLETRWPTSNFGLYPLPTVSDGVPRSQTALPSAGEVAKMFVKGVRLAIRRRSNVRINGPRAHWLAAILHIQGSALRQELARLELEARQIKRKRRQNAHLQNWQGYDLLYNMVQTTIDQTVTLQNDIEGFPEEDTRAELSIIHQLKSQIGRRLREAETSADVDVKLKTLEMTEMGINESRSAVALTFLAFIFVPVSLASSVFGMNVQEINQTGESIWLFFIVAAALILISLLALLTWRLYRKWRKLYAETHTLQAGQTSFAKRDQVKESTKAYADRLTRNVSQGRNQLTRMLRSVQRDENVV